MGCSKPQRNSSRTFLGRYISQAVGAVEPYTELIDYYPGGDTLA